MGVCPLTTPGLDEWMPPFRWSESCRQSALPRCTTPQDFSIGSVRRLWILPDLVILSLQHTGVRQSHWLFCSADVGRGSLDHLLSDPHRHATRPEEKENGCTELFISYPACSSATRCSWVGEWAFWVGRSFHKVNIKSLPVRAYVKD